MQEFGGWRVDMEINEKKDFVGENRFIAYLDILGYESHIAKIGVSGLANVLNESIKQSKEMITYFQKANEERSDNYDFDIKVFSDNFFFCTKKDWFGLALLSSLVQGGLMLSGILVRGSICYGEIYFSEDFVCGKGLIDAYKLESEIAIYPRIIIDSSYFDSVEKISTSNLDRLQKLSRKSGDGYEFLDYMRRCLGDDRLVSDFLNVQKKHVEDNLKETENNRVKQKYQWLKNYHNSFCKEHGYDEHLI